MSKYCSKTKPLPVRFDLPMRQRLKLAASRLGTTTSGVIRFAVFQQLQQIESGTIHLTDKPQPAVAAAAMAGRQEVKS